MTTVLLHKDILKKKLVKKNLHGCLHLQVFNQKATWDKAGHDETRRGERPTTFPHPTLAKGGSMRGGFGPHAARKLRSMSAPSGSPEAVHERFVANRP